MNAPPLLARRMTPLYARLAFPVLRRAAGVNPLVVYYHIVSDRAVPHVDPLYTFRTAAQFARDLDLLARHYRPMALRDYIASRKRGVPPPADALLVTFDDGLRECHEIAAPILNRKGIPAAFFLCSAFVDNRGWAFDFQKSVLAGEIRRCPPWPGAAARVRELLESVERRGPDLAQAVLEIDYTRRGVLEPIAAALGYDLGAYLKNARPYLTSGQVRELLRQGHSIGAHGIDHPRYGDIPLDEQLRQTRESVRFVKTRFGLDYGALAFPSSDTRVSRRFFREIGPEVDLFFGNRGLMDDPVPHCLQRAAMEKTSHCAAAILGQHYARRWLKRLLGRIAVERTEF